MDQIIDLLRLGLKKRAEYQRQLVLLGGHNPFDIKPARIAEHGLWHKPAGGLWTSTFIPPTEGDYASDWVNWCASEMPSWIVNKQAFICFVKPKARIYEITNYNNMMTLEKIAPWEHPIPELRKFHSFPNIDWVKLGEEYDGIHLTLHGQASTRFTMPSLNGWDCESTFWYRNVFSKIVPYNGRLVRGNAVKEFDEQLEYHTKIWNDLTNINKKIKDGLNELSQR